MDHPVVPQLVPSPWRPVGCKPDCLGGEAASTVSRVRRALRAVALGGSVLLTLVPLALIPRRTRIFAWAARGGARMICRAVGARIRVATGASWRKSSGVKCRGVLLVSNHISWLDSLVIQALCGPIRMVSMVEVRSWPLLGWITTRSGAIYIDRDRLSQLPRTVEEMAIALRAGEHVGAFPEGVTSCGNHRLVFRNAPFQAAIDAGSEVCVTQLSYRVAGRPSTQPSFVDTAGLSLWRVLGLRQVTVEAAFEYIANDQPKRTRKTLAARAQAVATELAGL